MVQILPDLVHLQISVRLQILVHVQIWAHVHMHLVLGACVCALDLAPRAQIVRKKKKNQTKFASRHLAGHATPKRFHTALSFRDFVFQVRFQNHKLRSNSLMPSLMIKISERGVGGRNWPGGVLYFLERRAGKCRGEASLFSAPPLICLPTGNKTLLKCVFPKILVTSIKYPKRPSFVFC